MKDPRKSLLSWEELRDCFIIKSRLQIRTGSPIVDDVLTRVVHWTRGPEELKFIIKKFVKTASDNSWHTIAFSIFDINFLKWYVGQWLAGMADQPIRWDEKLDNITTAKELAHFIVKECLPLSIDPF
jgi:hypothetical protein